MNFLEIYQNWLKNADDKEICEELEKVQGNVEEIKERFYKPVEFGTAGMRGIMGAGTNRLNIYTVRLASQGLSDYLLKNFEMPSVAISYDSRKNSKKFAIESAKVFAANGIKVYICDRLQPTPVLSFCTRYLRCSAGVMITASHNTYQYNGYKCYGSDGAQIVAETADQIFKNMLSIDIFRDIKLFNFEESLKNGIISYIKNEVYEEFLDKVISRRITKDAKFENLKIVYTPFNGTGNELVRKMFDKIGLKNVEIVKTQEKPDEKFTTCPYPNPEVPQAFDEALKMVKETGNIADILVGTDPDCDRLGAMVYHDGEYRLLCGNEIGVLLSNYVISRRKELGNCPDGAILVKTIVSSKMVDKICKKYNIRMIEVPIGFKYVGAEMRKLEQNDELDKFIFGFEESHGYLTGTHARDKDAVESSMLFVEMAAFYKSKGKTLIDVLNELGKELGFYSEKIVNFECKGIEGSKKISHIMSELRSKTPKNIFNLPIVKITDYLADGAKFKANMLVFNLESSEYCHTIIVRPSGTEPKIKVYVMCQSDSKKNADKLNLDIGNSIRNLLISL